MNRIIGPYPRDPGVAFQDYDARTTDVARRIADAIMAQLPGVTVEHIGSTAVPGCAGKGVVDLMLVYQPGQLGVAKELLKALGFQRQTHGHRFPETRPMRVGTLEHDGTVFRAHIHVLEAGSDEVTALRRFRDRLRADPQLVAAYVARKREILAAGVNEPADYTARKGKFIEDWLRSP